jgi:superfamily II DNA or RNA helicase
MIQLRPYQQTAVDEIRKKFTAGHKSVLFVLPTGGGKTFTFSYIAHHAATKGNRVLIMAHRQELVMQASLSLAMIGVKHNVVASTNVLASIKVQQVREFGKCFVDYASNVWIGSVQTIVRRLHKIPSFSLVIPDEAHHATAGQWKEILNYWPRARVLGVTATPIRGDGKGLGSKFGGIFDTMVLGPSVQELIKLGNLVPPRIIAPEEKLDLTGVRRTAGGDYNQKQLAEILYKERPSIFGNAVAHYRKWADGKKCIVFCASVAAAQAQAEAFNAAGYRFRSLDGTMEDADRRLVVAQLRDGNLDGITSCDIVSEGFDLPALEVAILQRPTQSLGLYLQQVGRVLRPSLGKTHGLIIDQVGNTIEHLPPHWPREWSLEGVVQKKGASAVPLVRVKVCPDCFSVHKPMPVCPVCGREYKAQVRDIDQKDGALIELTQAHEDALRKAKRMEQGASETLDDLLKLEKARGYKPGWARAIWIARSKKKAQPI